MSCFIPVAFLYHKSIETYVRMFNFHAQMCVKLTLLFFLANVRLFVTCPRCAICVGPRVLMSGYHVKYGDSLL
jgi:hypothetical protein